MQEGMGPIYDRTQEHLGTSDTGIIRVRRRLIRAACALKDRGATGPGALEPDKYKVRSCAAILGRNESWVEATQEQRVARAGVNHDAP